MSTASTLVIEPVKRPKPSNFRGHVLYRSAEREMLEEMATFPWTPLDTLEDAQEQDAVAAGFTTPRAADAQQVAHARGLVEHILTSGMLTGKGQQTLLTLTSDTDPKPRSRGMVLTLQAILNGGLPAFIVDTVEPPTEKRDCERYVTKLVMVYPTE